VNTAATTIKIISALDSGFFLTIISTHLG
jgi:hypothetical protein